ncbi:hypothetical protein SSX86_006150 [Deinandra increscens subsp. villosa]|uniref:histidine kinase n=1 Tax=Deinandra increscens subsp. villosa TaxID=3103831 RepID=A0AAP0DRT8_9ASTR
MEDQNAEGIEVEISSSMYPEDIDVAGKKLNVEKPGIDQDVSEDLTFNEDPAIVDFKHLIELTNHTEAGSSQLSSLVKKWEWEQEKAVILLREELENLRKQHEFELKKPEILQQHMFEDGDYGSDKRPVSILDHEGLEVEDGYDANTLEYWKQRALHSEKLLNTSVQREQILLEKLEESIEKLEKQSPPIEELSQILKRADNYIHFVLQNAPVVIGHQDKDLRYRFIYNHFPGLREEDIIGKTGTEIFKGGGVKESEDFKREVLEKGLPGKREITFETELFGAKTFLLYVEPVFSKVGETIGVNYMGMEITDQVRRREKMAKLREEIAVQKARETDLNKTIHTTEEAMRAKQILATMSHEIRSRLSGIISTAEVLSTTKLDKDQKQLLIAMLSSGDLVLQLINDILDFSKVEPGVMKLEATKFRPREVVKHVLQTAAASLKKIITRLQVIGDVLRIRQILTNLISNAVKFTHEGKIKINLYVIADPCLEAVADLLRSQGLEDQKKHEKNVPESNETTVWIQCDVQDTGIGIPETTLPSIFKKDMQAGADTTRKYGGTGLGLAICKQLVELMGGRLTVSSKVKYGSTFTFVKVPQQACESSDEYNASVSSKVNYGSTFTFVPKASESSDEYQDVDDN